MVERETRMPRGRSSTVNSRATPNYAGSFPQRFMFERRAFKERGSMPFSR
jgi:hypothetical protein